MSIIKLIISIIAVLIGGWLAADGTRALVTGDYFTPRSGPGAGQLGPWAKVVSAAGIDPRSQMMKRAHLGLGLCWLISALFFCVKPAGGWFAVAACSVASLWYLPLGTLLSIVELCLLVLPYARSLR